MENSRSKQLARFKTGTILSSVVSSLSPGTWSSLCPVSPAASGQHHPFAEGERELSYTSPSLAVTVKSRAVGIQLSPLTLQAMCWNPAHTCKSLVNLGGSMKKKNNVEPNDGPWWAHQQACWGGHCCFRHFPSSSGVPAGGLSCLCPWPSPSAARTRGALRAIVLTTVTMSHDALLS